MGRQSPFEELCILPPQKRKLLSQRREDQSPDAIPPSVIIKDQRHRNSYPIRNRLY